MPDTLGVEGIRFRPQVNDDLFLREIKIIDRCTDRRHTQRKSRKPHTLKIGTGCEVIMKVMNKILKGTEMKERIINEN